KKSTKPPINSPVFTARFRSTVVKLDIMMAPLSLRDGRAPGLCILCSGDAIRLSFQDRETTMVDMGGGHAEKLAAYASRLWTRPCATAARRAAERSAP